MMGTVKTAFANLLKQNRHLRILMQKISIGSRILSDDNFSKTAALAQKELGKTPSRTEIINYLMTLTAAENYLEIGVRKPESNFLKIHCKNKYAVDPGIEYKKNPVDFPFTSDDFFAKLKTGKLDQIKSDIRFDIIFIDGLHLADQVERDIRNSLEFIKEDGFIVLHDCNPPSEYHQREDYYFLNSPAEVLWNGTTWKAFYKYRHAEMVHSICFDTDWGVGVLAKNKMPLFNRLEGTMQNQFYEYAWLERERKTFLNLQSFEKWTGMIKAAP